MGTKLRPRRKAKRRETEIRIRIRQVEKTSLFCETGVCVHFISSFFSGVEGFLTAREMMAAASRLIQDRQSRGATGSMADMFSDKALEEVRCLSNTYMLFPLVFEQKNISSSSFRKGMVTNIRNYRFVQKKLGLIEILVLNTACV